MQVSPASLQDIPLIRQLAQQTWPQAYASILSKHQIDYMMELIYSIVALEHQIKDLHHRFYLLSNDAKSIGFASLSFKKKDEITTAKLQKIYILPQQQHKGAGLFLLNFIIEEAKKSQASTLELNVNRNNKNAISFYNKNGFQQIKIEDIDIGNGYFMNDFVLQKKL